MTPEVMEYTNDLALVWMTEPNGLKAFLYGIDNYKPELSKFDKMHCAIEFINRMHETYKKPEIIEDITADGCIFQDAVDYFKVNQTELFAMKDELIKLVKYKVDEYTGTI